MKSQFQIEDYSHFRSKFIRDTLLPVLVYPCLVTWIAFRLLRPDLGGLSSGISVFLSIPIWRTCVVSFRRWTQRRDAAKRGAKLIPKLTSGWPGNIDMLYRMVTLPKTVYLFKPLNDMLNKYKTTTINLNLLWGDQIITIDEGFVKYMLATGFEHFDKGYWQKEILEGFLGNGIFNRDGDIWKTHRAMTRPFFVKERNSDFNHWDKYATRTIEAIEGLSPGEPVDVQDLFARFTLDTASQFLFDGEIDTLTLPLPRPHCDVRERGSTIEGSFGAFVKAFEGAQDVAVLRTRRRGTWQLYEMFGDLYADCLKDMREYLDPIIDRAIQKKKDSGLDTQSVAEASSFLEYIVASTDDVNMIRDELINILLAARDTTASLLTNIVYLLAMHPEVLSKLRAEIFEAIPVGSMPSYEDLRALKYLRAVIYEALRLYPPVPADTRASRDEVVLVPTLPHSDFGENKDPRPYYLPPKTTVTYATSLIQRRKDLWGEDANEFDPLRFLDDGSGRLERMVKNPLMFVPFNAGPRICLGQQFALNEASFFLVRLLHAFESFELAPDAHPEGTLPPETWKEYTDSRACREKVWHQSAVTLYIKGGLWVRFRKGSTNM